MLAQRSVYDSPLVVNDAVRDYCKFLASMRHCDRVLEPTPLVDLVWHTHQQMPFHYRKDCLRLAGRLIDHHDSPCNFETIRKMHEGGWARSTWYVTQNDLVCFYMCERKKWSQREMERKCVRVVVKDTNLLKQPYCVCACIVWDNGNYTFIKYWYAHTHTYTHIHAHSHKRTWRTHTFVFVCRFK